MATRLGTKLLKLREQHPDKVAQIEGAVALLDKTIAVTGRRGAGIRLLSAWKTCLVLHKLLTGQEYTAK